MIAKSSALVTGGTRESLRDILIREFKESNPAEVWLASAFYTNQGASFVDAVQRATKAKIRLVIGLDLRVTHPRALERALENKYSIRVLEPALGIFHPKLFLALQKKERLSAVLSYVGSANLTQRALVQNIECGLLSGTGHTSIELAKAYVGIWKESSPLSLDRLRTYSHEFSLENSARTRQELVSAGVVEDDSEPPVSKALASYVWVTLETITGGGLQIEFPKTLGEILYEYLQTKNNEKFSVLCDDGSIRQMSYGWQKNHMYRLDVSTDTPLVAEIKASRIGVAVLSLHRSADYVIALSLSQRPEVIAQCVERSTLLGTLEHTPTRQYGWY